MFQRASPRDLSAEKYKTKELIAKKRALMMYYIKLYALVSAPQGSRRLRLKCLHNVLLSRKSPFLKFVYCCNGRRAEISDTEDIIDRIMSFI